MRRAETDYSVVLNVKLTDLSKRWSGIIDTTEKQKENLRNAGLKFQEVDAGLKEIISFLKQVDANIQKENLSTLEKMSLKKKLEEYQVCNDEYYYHLKCTGHKCVT